MSLPESEAHRIIRQAVFEYPQRLNLSGYVYREYSLHGEDNILFTYPDDSCLSLSKGIFLDGYNVRHLKHSVEYCQALHEADRLALSFPQIPRGYVSKRRTCKRRSIIYTYADGSRLEERNTRFLVWGGNYCLKRFNKFDANIYNGVNIGRMSVSEDKETGAITMIRRVGWFDEEKLHLAGDKKLNMIARIERVAFYAFGYKWPVVKYGGESKSKRRYVVYGGHRRAFRDVPQYV